MPRQQRPIVPEVNLEPVDPQELRRMRKRAKCDSSPTGAHYFNLTKQEDGTDDGPCKYCHRLHSEVHKKSRRQKSKNRKGERKNMANLITVNDLAKETGVDGRIIRRILRKSFGGGDKKAYGWEKGDPKLKEIRAAIKNRGTKAEKPAETKKTTKKAEKPAEKKETKKASKKTAPKKVEKPVKKEKKAAAEKPAEKPAETEKPTDGIRNADGTLNETGKKMRADHEKKNKAVNDHIKKTGKAPTTAELDAAMKQ